MHIGRALLDLNTAVTGSIDPMVVVLVCAIVVVVLTTILLIFFNNIVS